MVKKTTDTDSKETPKRTRGAKKSSREKTDEPQICAFCGKPSIETHYLFKGQYTKNAYICDSCSQYLSEMSANMQSLVSALTGDYDVNDDGSISTDTSTNVIKGNMTPLQIKQYLDDYVIGQDMAKMRLAVAVYNHYKRVRYAESHKDADMTIEKSNVLMIGESGTGKTLLCKTLAKMMNVPFTIVDATVFTEAGYVGEDIESILTRALQAADFDIELTQKSIVYIDEFDKLARKGGSNPSITKDVGGEGVQQGLLKMLEGCKVNVPTTAGRKHPEKPTVEIDTSNILFICGGAFEGIDKIISSRMNMRSVGYRNENREKVDDNKIMQYVNTEDLKKYGIIPELLGRIPIITSLDKLSEDDMVRIITEPKNAIIKQFKKLFELDNMILDIDDDVYKFIVDKAIEKKLGARGLRSIIENIMTTAMFNAPTDNKKELHITLEYAKTEYNKYVGDVDKVA